MIAAKRICVSVGLVSLAAVLAAAFPACSGGNQEGPLVSCQDLQCGRINACEEGIIAQCADGLTVRYHACSSDKALCDADWQIPGQYRCTASATDCEGCRPESAGCDSVGLGGAGNVGGGGDVGGAGGASAGLPVGGGGQSAGGGPGSG